MKVKGQERVINVEDICTSYIHTISFVTGAKLVAFCQGIKNRHTLIKANYQQSQAIQNLENVSSIDNRSVNYCN